MGQYYYPVLGHKKIENRQDIKWFYSSHRYDNGMKLMEHSYVGNRLVNAVCKDLEEHGPLVVVWAGDYADNIVDDMNINMLCDETPQKQRYIELKNYETPRYYINLDKNEYVDINKCRTDKYGYTIHPLPILTSEGNGRGGGDYKEEDNPFIGEWSNNLIKVSRDDEEVKKYTEIIPDFYEE